MSDYLIYLYEVYIRNFTDYYIYFFLSVIILHLLTKIAKYVGLVDIPVERSLHTKPTPRGGGIALVLVIILANLNILKICPEFILSGLLIAIIGLKDDIKPMRALPKLITQFIVVALIIFLLPIQNPIKGIPVYLIKIILFFSGVWFINIYNFMDGIDGLAGGYTNTAAVGFLFCIKGNLLVEDWNIIIYTQLIYISLSFLIFNWYPAKIFMGDTGSTFIGFTFFSLGCRGLLYGNYIMYSFIIIMSFFWIDATLTLTKRLIKGKNILRAHKEHAFQKAAAIFGHWKVTLFIIFITLFWLNPMAKLAVNNINYAPLITLISVIPILFCILLFKPGEEINNYSKIIINYINERQK
jgi:Fuc2NAc and GlcNAc transferase